MLGFFAVLSAVLSVARVVCDWKPVLESRKASFPRPSSPLTPPPVPRERQKLPELRKLSPLPARAAAPVPHPEFSHGARPCVRQYALSPPFLSTSGRLESSRSASVRGSSTAAIAKDRQAPSASGSDRAATVRARRPPRASRAPRIDRIDRANARTRRFFRTTASTCVPPRRPATPTRTPRGTRLW